MLGCVLPLRASWPLPWKAGPGSICPLSGNCFCSIRLVGGVTATGTQVNGMRGNKGMSLGQGEVCDPGKAQSYSSGPHLLPTRPPCVPGSISRGTLGSYRDFRREENYLESSTPCPKLE